MKHAGTLTPLKSAFDNFFFIKRILCAYAIVFIFSLLQGKNPANK
jgi:hypothetical protein